MQSSVRNSLGAAAISLALAFPALSRPSELSPPAAAAGYKLAFADDFDRLNLSPDGLGSYTWYEGIWFSHKHAPRSNIWVSDSQLNLVWRSGQASADTSLTTFSRDKQHFKAWRYGYYEVRAKWDVVKGAWPAFWLIPVQGATGNSSYQGVKETGELDIFEGQGALSHNFHGTIHDWIETKDHFPTGNTFRLKDEQDLNQFHTYGVLWVPGKVTWYFDDQPLHSEATAAVFDRQDYFLVIGMQEGVNWKFGDTTGVDATKMALTVDWVRVWQKK